jgi:carbonic anhydrase
MNQITAALSKLEKGNERFRNGLRSTESLATVSKLKELAEKGQRPYVSLLACADSRVPAETIFDAGLGELFVCRVAGSIATAWMIGSIEYAALALGTPLTVVLGHTKCGAVKAAIDKHEGRDIGIKSAHVERLADSIAPAVRTVRGKGATAPVDFLNLVCAENARHQMEEILAQSAVLRDLRRDGKWDIVSAVYDLDSGKVTFESLEPVRA